MIYIHVPFCHRKCTYCAFYSLGSQRQELMHSYAEALIGEIHRRHTEATHAIRTLYFGGGTPSILPLDEVAHIADTLRNTFDLTLLEEATIECNPEDLTGEYLQGLRSTGLFNRISIGLQCLDDAGLRLLGRRHTADDALQAVERCHALGFQNISVDLMYGLPIGVDGDIARLKEVLPAVTHISAYALTVEPNTALARQVEMGRLTMPDDDEVARQYHTLNKRLQAWGFSQYEVSNYARPGYQSRHNSRYWDRTPYLGLGPAAHSFDGRKRRWNVSDVREYIHEVSYEEETLTDNDAYNELLMTSLRTTRGIALADIPPERRREFLPFERCGWLRQSDGRLVPSPEGLLHADGMAASLFVK